MTRPTFTPRELAGNAKAATDPPPYPHEWTTEQRLTAYWFALNNEAWPAYTSGWPAILQAAQRKHDHIQHVTAADQPPKDTA
jgi:hypothetical protein